MLGSAEFRERARRIAGGLGTAVIYAGFSLGVELAQMLAQTRPGAVQIHETLAARG